MNRAHFLLASLLSSSLATSLAAAADTPQPPGSPAASRSELPALVDEQYRMACGPISVYVALKRIGQEATLEEIIRHCNWVEGQETKFETLLKVLRDRPGLQVRAVRLSPDELLGWLSDGDHRAAILPVRKFAAGADHALCAVGAGNRRIRIVDYPELAYDSSPEKLADVWNGEAILISERPSPLASNVGVAILPGLILGLATTLLVRRG